MSDAQKVHEMLMRSDPQYRARQEARDARAAEIGDRYSSANLGAEGQVGYTDGGDLYTYIREDGTVGRTRVDAENRRAFEKEQERRRKYFEAGKDPSAYRSESFVPQASGQQASASNFDPSRMALLSSLMGSMGGQGASGQGFQGIASFLNAGSQPQQQVGQTGAPVSPYGSSQQQPSPDQDGQGFWKFMQKYGGG